MTEPIKAKCCETGRSCIYWVPLENGGEWRMDVRTVTRMHMIVPVTRCPDTECGSELKKPLPEVVLPMDEYEVIAYLRRALEGGRLIADGYCLNPKSVYGKAIISLAGRSRKAE
jgi:hypothetical protein